MAEWPPPLPPSSYRLTSTNADTNQSACLPLDGGDEPAVQAEEGASTTQHVIDSTGRTGGLGRQLRVDVQRRVAWEALGGPGCRLSARQVLVGLAADLVAGRLEVVHDRRQLGARGGVGGSVPVDGELAPVDAVCAGADDNAIGPDAQDEGGHLRLAVTLPNQKYGRFSLLNRTSRIRKIEPCTRGSA